MQATASAAGRLYNALAPGLSAVPPREPDATPLAARSPRELIAGIVEAVRPVDGTLDAEGARRAIHNAMAEVLDVYPQADLNALTDEERLFVVTRFVGEDVFEHFMRDVGQSILKNAPNASAAQARLADVRDYVHQVVAAAFRNTGQQSGAIDGATIRSVVQGALTNALSVFGETT